MNDLDQRQLANRLADALATRIGTSLKKIDLDGARKDLEHLFSLETRGDATRIAELFKAVLADWPAGTQGSDDIVTKLRSAEGRVVQQAADHQIGQALQNTAVRSLGDAAPISGEVLARIRRRAAERPQWPFPPLFFDAWTDAEPDQLVDDVVLLDRALSQDAFFQAVLGVGIVGGRRCALSCYQATLVELLLEPQASNGPGAAVFMVGAFGALPIEGTSPRIHALNAQNRLDISDEAKAIQYLRFFGGVVHGDEGPFTLVSGRDEIVPFLTIPDPNALPPVLSMLASPVVTRPDDQESKHRWVAEVGVIYSNAVFKAKFGLIEGGMVEMISDEPIAGDLPIRQPKFRKGIRLLAQQTQN